MSHAVLAHDAHRGHDAPPAAAKVVLRNDPLVDATGKSVRLAKDVIGERIAVVNFIYTTCTTVCPVSSATFAQLQGKLGKDVVLISISVDPVRDTPERLREYAGRYGAREGWVWLTGAKRDVDATLKGFGAYAPNFEDHPAMVMVGSAGSWTRLFGFPSADEITARVESLRMARQVKHSPVDREAKAREYFTDTLLRTESNRAIKFYSDALKGKVVLISFVFTQCTDACPLITARLVQVKKELGDAFGRDVRFLSISIDPENDRPQDLARFAQKLDAVHPEWWFLTGDKANLDAVVKKLGAFTPERESHLTAMIIGATSQARWKKVRPDAPPAIVAEELRQLVAAQAEARTSAQWAR